MIRGYQAKDLPACSDIVNRVWDFDGRIKPKELSEFFKTYYVAGLLAESNFNVVVEEDSKTAGFLFGRRENKNLYRNQFSGLPGNLWVLYQLLSMGGVRLKKKFHYIRIISEHEANRRRVEPSRENEVNLFAVDPAHQGKGYGEQLMNSFIDYCRKGNVKRITLESDEECNYGFYDHSGFTLKGEFYSPLQEEYSGKSGRSFVYELKLL